MKWRRSSCTCTAHGRRSTGSSRARRQEQRTSFPSSMGCYATAETCPEKGVILAVMMMRGGS